MDEVFRFRTFNQFIRNANHLCWRKWFWVQNKHKHSLGLLEINTGKFQLFQHAQKALINGPYSKRRKLNPEPIMFQMVTKLPETLSVMQHELVKLTGLLKASCSSTVWQIHQDKSLNIVVIFSTIKWLSANKNFTVNTRKMFSNQMRRFLNSTRCSFLYT